MKIEHEFTVGVAVDRAWEVLTDLEGIAPCLPGATLTGRDGDDYHGRVKVKLGPVTSEFTGTARFVEKDDAARRAVIQANGREVRGGGNASAAITASLRADADHTVVSVDTDLRVVGKLAQFGSGMIQEVSTGLLSEFTDCLERNLTTSGSDSAGRAVADDAVSPGAEAGSLGTEVGSTGTDAPPESAEATADVTASAGGALAKRLVPLVLGMIAVVVVLILVVS